MKVDTFDMGDSVQCDLCGALADDSMVGGFVFASNAVCPACAPAMLKDIEKYGEGAHIRMRALEGETFQAFVLRMRGGNNAMTIINWGPGDEPGSYPWGREKGDG